MREFIVVACLIGTVLGLWNLWEDREQSQPPGMLISYPPTQWNAPAVEFQRDEFRMVARAHFEITARVLRKEHYRFDRMAGASPVDLALGWQRMSDSAILDQMTCGQGQRFYECSWRKKDLIDWNHFTTQSANMHMIPATKKVEETLMSVRKGQIVSLRGYLVDVHHPNGGKWRTSLIREDWGPGACEIIWVTHLTVS